MSISEGWLMSLVITTHDLGGNVDRLRNTAGISDGAYKKVCDAKLKLIEVERLLDDARLLEQQVVPFGLGEK